MIVAFIFILMKIEKIYLLILFSLIIGDTCESNDFIANDICEKSTLERNSSNYTFQSSIPKGGIKAGKHATYTDVDEATCYKTCCDNKMCNVAWFLKRHCVTFECDIKDFDKCMPVTTQKTNLALSKFLLLRYPSPNKRSSSNYGSDVSTVSSTPLLTTPSTTNIRILKVEVSNNKTITLPQNNVTLLAYVPGDKGSKYEYQWSLLSKPSDKNSGKMDTTKSKELKLTELIVGDYLFQVEVRGNNSYGKAIVSVFVKPALKLNEPPVARIEPHDQVVQLPNNVILDGTKSSDDDKVVSYYWELVKGPLEANKNIKYDQSMLNLENLVAGNYTFKLTVKDVTGASASDIAYLAVLAEKDFPPQVDPGHNIIVELPVKFVILNGSGSRDDKKIVSYEWTKKSDGLTADIQGVREPILNLTNLQEGTYTFNLKITDSAGQSADKDVQIFVKPRTNSKPAAKASVSDDKSVTVRLPATEAVLNGSLSSDDEKITKYVWQQIEGVPTLNLVDADKAIAYVYDLKIGVFKFNLTVYDKENLASSDIVTLRINESKNQSPKAKIEKVPDYCHFENNLIKVDGSKSWDDVKIVQFKWTREDDSLAIGEVLENSDASSILMLTDFLPGLYKFKLQVFDGEGLFDITATSIVIKPSKYERYLVELQFISSLNDFIEMRKNAFITNIQQIIQKKLNLDTFRFVIHSVQLNRNHFKNSMTMVFYVTYYKGSKSSLTKTVTDLMMKNMSTNNLLISSNKAVQMIEDGVVVEEVHVEALRVVEALSMMRHNNIGMDFQLVRVETYVCQNNCSDHGRCDKVTKLCECDSFWTSSFFRERFGDGRPNCDWSIIYLSIFLGMVTLMFIITCWLLLWIRQRKCKSKKTVKIRKHKYMKLIDHDHESRLSFGSKVPKSLANGVKSRVNLEKSNDSVLTSDSSLSSEENTTFINTSLHRGDHSPIKKALSFSSMPTANGNPQKTL